MNIEKSSNNKFVAKVSSLWLQYKEKHLGILQFLVFFLLSNGITFLQMLLMTMLKGVFEDTALINTSFQVIQVGQNFDESPYYVFNYVVGKIAFGGGDGLAYFLAVQISMAIAQVINFFAQRNVAFKSNGTIGKAAFWL